MPVVGRQQHLKEYIIRFNDVREKLGSKMVAAGISLVVILYPTHERAISRLVTSIAHIPIESKNGTASGLKIGEYVVHRGAGRSLSFVRGNAYIGIKCSSLEELEVSENKAAELIRTLSTPSDDAERCENLALQIDQELQRLAQQLAAKR
jgi:hypothetical protein